VSTRASGARAKRYEAWRPAGPGLAVRSGGGQRGFRSSGQLTTTNHSAHGGWQVSKPPGRSAGYSFSREAAARCVSVESSALAQKQKQSGRSWLGEKAVARCFLSCASA